MQRDRREADRSDDERDKVVFDQETFAGKVHQLLWKGNPVSNFVELGKIMRKRGREAPRVDFLDGKLFFDEIVAEERWQRWQEEERREWRELWGDERVDLPEE